MARTTEQPIEELEVELLLEAIQRRYGYDFRHYARGLLQRRLAHRAAFHGLISVGALIPATLHQAECEVSVQ